MTMEIDSNGVKHPQGLHIGEQIEIAQIKRLYEENEKLMEMAKSLTQHRSVSYKNPNATIQGGKEIKAVSHEDIRKQKAIRAQLILTKALFRKSTMSVRDEKVKTAEARNVNDALILQLHNLRYEEQSLSAEISAATNYDHEYMKLPLISVESFVEQFPEHENEPEEELMSARIDHEYQARKKLEDQRQEKLTQKQRLIAEVKKGKDDLTKLDSMLENFIEAADPIKKVLAVD
ncbi:hypothetical protein EJ04DRAFT_455743 [Polyplosphaeria fusca]|uniref:Uncharacterized protein n=1 Tax=Polyplosphaeria fusca TaxID=682080 RepID=A0A9P4RBU6_9PLEO|nr:hypothetical protein EJ04DRAFT_455743 [Polyplosphaeria fusca]